MRSFFCFLLLPLLQALLVGAAQGVYLRQFSYGAAWTSTPLSTTIQPSISCWSTSNCFGANTQWQYKGYINPFIAIATEFQLGMYSNGPARLIVNGALLIDHAGGTFLPACLPACCPVIRCPPQQLLLVVLVVLVAIVCCGPSG